jgi:hypothetical protein
VIVGVIAMQVVQPPVMDEIDMIAMLDAHMLLAGMAVPVIVSGDAHGEFLGFGIGIADLDHMLIDMPAMRVVEVAVVEIVDMACMFERLMAAALRMGVAFMRGMDHLVRTSWGGGKGKREGSQVKGSVHDMPSMSDDPVSLLRRITCKVTQKSDDTLGH